jgi:HAMP domain-containing protein
VNDLIVFFVIVAAMTVVGIALGMIVAGRIDRRTAPREAASAVAPPEPPTAPPAPQEEQS